MTSADIETAIRQILQRMLPGRRINDDFRPVDEGGLESVDGVQIASDVELDVGICIPDDVNPLIDESGGQKRARTFREIVALFSRAAGGVRG